MLVDATGLYKSYRNGAVEVQAIRGADFPIAPASFVAFVGPSGSGKSTLINMMGCLDHPSSGKPDWCTGKGCHAYGPYIRGGISW